MNIGNGEEFKSPVEFMSALEQAINEALQDQVNMTFTVSLIHRAGDENKEYPAIFEYSLDETSNAVYEGSISRDKLFDVMEYMVDVFKDISPIPKFSLDNIQYAIDNVFEDICSGEEMSQDVKHLHKNAEFNGLASQIRFIIHNGKVLEINYILNAEVHADTSKEDMEQAKKLGLSDSFKPAPSDHIVPMLTINAVGFTSL